MRRGVLAFGAALALFTPSSASAQGIGEVCSNAYEQAQQLQRDKALLRSRAELRVCVNACPAALVRDCQTWLAQVERDIPSIVLSATSVDGRTPDGVRVLIDGAPLVAALPKAPVEVDPGRHTLRFEDASGARVEAVVTLLPGDKALPITVRFPAREPAPSSRPRWPLLLLGAGAVGLGVGAVLGIKGQLDRSHLRDTCAPRCSPEQIDAIDTEWKVGAIFAGAGLALSGVGTAMYLLRAPAEPAAPLAIVSLSPGGAWLSLGGAF